MHASAGASAGSHPSPAGELLTAWLEREGDIRRSLEAGAGHGVIDPRQIGDMTGIEVMRAMMEGRLPAPTISRAMDFILVHLGEGSAIFQGAPGPDHLNPMGTVHGGWYATLLDSAMGCAVHTLLPPERGYTTTNLSVNLVRAIPGRVQRVRAEGRVLHCGRQLASAEARLIGPDGTVYAHGTSTCLVFEARR